MKYLKVLLYGIYAGLAIGLGSFVFTIVSTYMGDTTAGKIFASALFSVGLILVCVLGLQLYTGKIGVVFDDREKLKENAINLPIMLVGNAIGAFALGILCHFIFMNLPEVASKIKAISEGSSTITITTSNNTKELTQGGLTQRGRFCSRTEPSPLRISDL